MNDTVVVDASASRRTIFIVSDASGESASQMMSVMLEQFKNVSVAERRFPHVRTLAQIAQIMHAAAEIRALVFYTLVGDGMAETARIAAEGLGVRAVDLFALPISALAKWLGEEPSRIPGHAFDEKYFARMEAIDFAQRCDDGKRPQEMVRADVVILGLSRTGKTPACRALAEHRILAANVPIISGVASPVELQHVDPRRIYVLQMGIERLLTVRASRLNNHGMDAGSSYVDRHAVREEVLMITRLLTQHPEWMRIDVTSTSVEETAAKIMSLHQERFP